MLVRNLWGNVKRSSSWSRCRTGYRFVFVLSMIVGATDAAAEDQCPDMPGQLIAGKAAAIAGGTIAVAGKTILLADILAPGHEEVCLGASGKVFACGEQARAALQAKITSLGEQVDCLAEPLPSSTTFYGFCGRLGRDNCIERDIGGEMAVEGLARVARVREHQTNYLYFDGAGAEKRGEGFFSHVTTQRGYFNSEYWLLDEFSE